jgi:hypothetical protein
MSTTGQKRRFWQVRRMSGLGGKFAWARRDAPLPTYGYGDFVRGAAEGPPKKRKKRESGGSTSRVLSGFSAAS